MYNLSIVTDDCKIVNAAPAFALEKNLTYTNCQDIKTQMEKRIINILLDIKADIGGLKKDVGELKEDVGLLKEGQQRLEGRMDILESDVAELKTDMSEVKSTVNALADALLETSKEVKQMKGKAAHL